MNWAMSITTVRTGSPGPNPLRVGFVPRAAAVGVFQLGFVGG